jgi:hypothetical protein
MIDDFNYISFIIRLTNHIFTIFLLLLFNIHIAIALSCIVYLLLLAHTHAHSQTYKNHTEHKTTKGKTFESLCHLPFLLLPPKDPVGNSLRILSKISELSGEKFQYEIFWNFYHLNSEIFISISIKISKNISFWDFYLNSAIFISTLKREKSFHWATRLSVTAVELLIPLWNTQIYTHMML